MADVDEPQTKVLTPPGPGQFDVSTNEWNKGRRYINGEHGQVLTRDTTEPNSGAAWKSMMPAESYASPTDIPLNTFGFVVSGTSPNRQVSIYFNDNGILHEWRGITI
jgi:hypothetical protein